MAIMALNIHIGEYYSRTISERIQFKGEMFRMGHFILKTDTINKTINIELEGTFSEEDGLKSIQAYQQTVNPITPAEYDLKIDCRKLQVTEPDVVPLLGSCFVMFKNDGFVRVTLILENNPVLKMQLSRLGRKAGLGNIEIISVVTV
jgi:hypothetical protein